MSCPAGLEWNDKKKECDWRQNSTCSNKPTNAPTAAPTQKPTEEPTAAPTQAPTNPPTAAPTQVPTNSPDNGFQCPRDDITNTGCKGPKDCLYPNPANCNSFIQCVPQPDGSGKPQVMPCPVGLEWNDNKKECDWSQDSTCPNKPTNAPTKAPTSPPNEPPTNLPTEPQTDKPTTTSAPVETTTPVCGEDPNQDNNLDLPSLCSGCWKKHLVANPNSQERYVECNGGPNNVENSVKKCSPGLLFDKDRLTCDYHGLVNGY
jgi:hypothetical protein